MNVLHNRTRLSGYQVILIFLIIPFLAQAQTVCSFGNMNPPPSSQQYVNNQYYLTSPTTQIPIGTFTGTACSGTFSYRISSIKDANGVSQILSSFPAILSATPPISLNIQSSDSSLVALSPYTVEIEASCLGTSCLQYQYILVTFMSPNPCSAAPLSLNPLYNGVQDKEFTETT